MTIKFDGTSATPTQLETFRNDLGVTHAPAVASVSAMIALSYVTIGSRCLRTDDTTAGANGSFYELQRGDGTAIDDWVRVGSGTPLPRLALSDIDMATATEGTYASETDPLGSGRVVQAHRINWSTGGWSAGATGHTCRSEYTWTDPATELVPGRDYWWALGWFVDTSAETIKYDATDGSVLIWQTHTPATGDTQPDISMHLDSWSGNLRIRVAYNTFPAEQWSYNGGAKADTEGNPTILTHNQSPSSGDPIVPANTWQKYIVHYRPGFLDAHEASIEIWRKLGSGAWTKLTFTNSLTSWTPRNGGTYNTYNTGTQGGYSYLRKGIYKWSSEEWQRQAYTVHMTPMYFAPGVNLLDQAKEAMALY
jgi:hypothetical protein